MRVVTDDQGQNLPGDPYVYVKMDLTEDRRAADAEVDLAQNTRLVRNDEFAPGAVTWRAGFVASSPTAQSMRDGVKDLVDKFLNAWLSVNPKK